MEGHQKPTTAAQEKAARNEQKQAALAALADKEAELQQMSSLRINLEHCRMLMDLCKRREKLKKQLAVATAAAYAERLQHPAQALEFMETLRQFETEGLTPGQQLELIFGADGMDSYLMPPPPVLQIAPPPGQRSGRTTPRLMSGALPDEDEGSQGRVRRTTGPLTSKRQRGEAPEFPGLTHTPAVAPVDLGQAKRARRGGATPPPPGFADGAVGGASPPIQMAMMLNSHEAQKLNQQLPPKIKFVPSHTLLQQAGSGGLDAAEGSDGGATRRARAERAAARGGPGEGEDSGTGGGGRIRYRG